MCLMNVKFFWEFVEEDNNKSKVRLMKKKGGWVRGEREKGILDFFTLLSGPVSVGGYIKVPFNCIVYNITQLLGWYYAFLIIITNHV